MSSPLVAAAVGLLLWVAPLAIAWHRIGIRRHLPAALRWPGFVAVLPLAFVLRGAFGEASAALPAMILLAASPLGRPGRLFLGVLVAAALALYASALGFFATDFYSVGYAPSWGVAVVAAAALAAYRWLPALAWAWLAGLGLSAAGLHPSPNLFDALIDLPSVLIAARLVLRRSIA